MKLSARKVQTADKGTYQDGNGLSVIKSSKERGKWNFRFQMNKKRRDMGLGSWPEVSLAVARDQATAARDQIRRGIDPIRSREIELEKLQAIPTLKDCIYAAHAARQSSLRGGGKSGRWLSPLELHVIPKIGDQLITDINQNMIADALRPIWRTKYPTADKAMGRLNVAMEYAVAQGHNVNLTAVKMARILLGNPGHTVKHIEAMPWQEVPAFYQSIGNSSVVRRVLSLMLLTGGGARTAPVRLARFDEIDGNEWTIPAEKMKGQEGKTKPFRIPLSDPALELIAASRRTTDGDWIFPGPSGKPITDVMTSKFMRDNGLSYKPHGFRSSFRDWMAHTEVPFEVAETALAHSVGTKVTRAYLRDDYWDRRVKLMDDWAAYLLSQPHPSRGVRPGSTQTT